MRGEKEQSQQEPLLPGPQSPNPSTSSASHGPSRAWQQRIACHCTALPQEHNMLTPV